MNARNTTDRHFLNSCTENRSTMHNATITEPFDRVFPCAPYAKHWGTNQVLYRDEHVELVRAVIRRGGYSSRHLHRGKDNTFRVVRGRLLLITYLDDFWPRCTLEPFDGLYTFPAGIEHRFVALDDNTVLYELYHAVDGRPPSPDDIVRRDCGGILAGDPMAFADAE